MIEHMLRNLGLLTAAVSAILLVGCGTSTPGPDGSKHQTMTGSSADGYPGGQPKDAESPALSSSTEQQYSRAEAPAAGEAEKPAK